MLHTFDFSLKPVKDEAGRVVLLIPEGRDITERKRAEEAHARLATAVEQAAEAIVITDTSGQILYVNPAFEKTAGYPRQEAVGQNPRILKSGKHDSAFYRQMWDSLAQGKVWSGRIINKKKNGALYEEEMTISPIRDSAGKIINYVAVKHDVTQEVALEEQLRQVQKMESIGQLAGGVAHDFNNILTVIQGNASLLLDAKNLSEADVDLAKQIINAAERAAGLTRQLLVFSRKQVMQPAHLNLNRGGGQHDQDASAHPGRRHRLAIGLQPHPSPRLCGRRHDRTSSPESGGERAGRDAGRRAVDHRDRVEDH